MGIVSSRTFRDRLNQLDIRYSNLKQLQLDLLSNIGVDVAYINSRVGKADSASSSDISHSLGPEPWSLYVLPTRLDRMTIPQPPSDLASSSTPASPASLRISDL